MHPLEWSISRDPEVFIDPDAFNPVRWIDSKYPTYQEPLSKFPTITSYSQFGYGRRTCQGMGVTEADLFVGIGSIAWLFSMQAATDEVEAEDAAERSTKRNAERPATGLPTGLHTPPDEKEVELELNEKALSALEGKLTNHSNDSGISIPGHFPIHSDVDSGLATPPPSPSKITGKASKLAGRPEMPRVKSMFASPPTSPSAPSETSDPTMNFSSLLIAKPMPFKFTLQIRDQVRAEKVARDWMDLKMEGEFADSRVFWQGGNHGNQQFGWSKVWT